MLEKANTRIVNADVYARVEYNTHIEVEVSDQATEEEIQRELDETAQLAVAENLQTYQGLQPEITITRLDEEEKPEQEPVHRYQVEVSTHQMLHQVLKIVSETPLSDEQITERAFEEAQKGVWTQGDIDESIDINKVSETR